MSGDAARRRLRTADGQATVEVALVVPLVVLLALTVVQVGVLVHDQVLVTAAAREAARAGAVSTADADVRRAAGAAGGLDPGRLTVGVTRGPPAGGLVEVQVSYAAPTAVPVVGGLLPDVVLTARAAMRAER